MSEDRVPAINPQGWFEKTDPPQRHEHYWIAPHSVTIARGTSGGNIGIEVKSYAETTEEAYRQAKTTFEQAEKDFPAVAKQK